MVEYALILVLVAIVVIAVLLLLGPVVGDVFSNVVVVLQEAAGGAGGGSGVITDVTASRVFFGTLLRVTVYVSEITTVSLSGDVSHSGQTCNDSCQFTFWWWRTGYWTNSFGVGDNGLFRLRSHHIC